MDTKYYIYYKEYDADEHDSIREISKEEYDKILPHADWFSSCGNGIDPDPPDDISRLVWLDIRDRDAVDVKLSELDTWDFLTTIEVAVC